MNRHFPKHESVKEVLIRDFAVENAYSLGGLLGRGGNAEVYECIRALDNSRLAVKCLRWAGKDAQERFEREIETASKYAPKYKNILPIFEHSKTSHWYIMPIASCSMNERAKFSDEEEWSRFVVSEIRDIAVTLAGLHSLGIYHRDIKPENILVLDGHFVISDFGLVRDKSVRSDLTISAKKLGPVFTMAPEMRRMPEASDYGAADVYSLAKSLWMFLMGDEKGFDGQYNYEDDHVYLHKDGKYQEVTLALIERLLHMSTDNEPKKRPTMEEFSKVLDGWLKIRDVPVLSQRSEWNILMLAMFGGNVPKSAVYEATDDIVKIINLVTRRPSLNHMLFPDGGGMDFTGVSRAKEAGCIEINSQNIISILKPKQLYVETFKKGEYNYLLLEADQLAPLVNVDDSNAKCQFVVEDIPGHYVSAKYHTYGVYDYDTGEKFPNGWRVVRRYCSGKFLIVPKSGFYNRQSVAYAGCHNKFSHEEFRKRIDAASILEDAELIAKTSEKDSLYLSEKFWRSIFGYKDGHSDAQKCVFSDMALAQAVETLDFSAMMRGVHNELDAKLEFWVVLYGLDDVAGFDFIEKEAILQKNGKFAKVAKVDDNTYFAYNRKEAELLCAEVIRCLHEKFDCDDSKLSGNVYAWAEWRMLRKPERIPELEELRAAIECADDRKFNRLVIDEEGFVKVIESDGQRASYPVESEIYCAGNKYVGKYACYSDEEYAELYSQLLTAFLMYVKTGINQRIEFVVFSRSIGELLTELKDMLAL